MGFCRHQSTSLLTGRVVWCGAKSWAKLCGGCRRGEVWTCDFSIHGRCVHPKNLLGEEKKVLRAPVLSWHYLRSPCPVHAADSQSLPVSLFKRERIRAAEPLALMIDSIILNSNCRKKKKERVSPMIKPTARRGGLPLKFFT